MVHADHVLRADHQPMHLLVHIQVSLFLLDSLITLTSSSPTPIEAYYGKMDDGTVDLLLNWGPIIFIPLVPFVAWLFTLPAGLSRSIRLGACLSTLGCTIRYIPCFLSDEARADTRVWMFLHVGQIFNAAAGPVFLAAPSLLSAVWFPLKQRTTATAIAYLGGNLGSAIGFLIGPYIIQDDPANVATLLSVELAMSLVPFFCVLVFCPDKPRITLHHLPTIRKPVSIFLRELLATVTSPSLLLLSFFGGVQAGVSSGWGGVLPQVLAPPEFSSVFSGWCGCATSLAGVVGNLLAGVVGDRFFPTRLKGFLVTMYFISGIFFVLFALSLPNPFVDTPPIPRTAASMLILIILSGFFQSACDPLFYELAAEISYPLPEGTSACLITLLFNAATLVMLFVAPAVSTDCFNTIMALTMLVGGAGTWLFVREAYLRREVETAAAISAD